MTNTPIDPALAADRSHSTFEPSDLHRLGELIAGAVGRALEHHARHEIADAGLVGGLELRRRRR